MPRTPSRRNAQGNGSIRQRKNGTWEARYTVGRDPGTGKQIQKSIYGSTQKEVAQKLKKIETTIDVGQYFEPSKMSVKDWMEIWTKDYLIGIKHSTMVSYKQIVENHITPSLGAIKLSALTRLHIQNFITMLTKKDLSPKTIKNVHGALHTSLDRAVLLSLIPSNPSDSCILPRIEKPEIHPLDAPEITAFLSALSGNRFENLFIVDLFTGLREGEILGLEWPRVSFDNDTLLIDRQLLRPRQKGDVYTFGSLKNDKLKRCTPSAYVFDALKRERKNQAEKRLLAGPAWDESEFPGLVFTNDFGAHLCYSTVLKELRKVLQSVGIEPRRFHDLRHTFAVLSLRAGDDPKTVQENLGHATAAFTLDKYGHYTATMRKDSARRMDGMIENILPKSSKG